MYNTHIIIILTCLDQMANRPRGYGFTAEIKNKVR